MNIELLNQEMQDALNAAMIEPKNTLSKEQKFNSNLLLKNCNLIAKSFAKSTLLELQVELAKNGLLNTEISKIFDTIGKLS